MLDPGVVHEIDGAGIGRPTNAFNLTHHFHRMFGDFNLYFEPVLLKSYMYKIDSPITFKVLRDPLLPVARTLHLTLGHTIDPPSPRFLAIHCACVLILLSDAGAHIDNILRDMDEGEVNEDGSSNLVLLVRLKMGGWLSNVDVC